MRTLLLLCSLLLSFSTIAQDGKLRGKVTLCGSDQSTDSVTVIASSKDFSHTFQTETNAQGKYIFENLPPANYNIEFSKEGLAQKVIHGVVVQENKITFQDLCLHPASYAPKRRYIERRGKQGKADRRLERMEQKSKRRMEKMDKRAERRFDQMDKRNRKMEKRIDKMEKRLAKRMDKMDKKSSMDKKMKKLEKRMNKFDKG